MRLAALVLVRDDARLLGDCLASVREVVDETVVVDNGSRDASVAVARRSGSRVIACHDRHLDEARNAALARVDADWVLVIDADERLAASTAGTLRRQLASAASDVLALTVRRFDYFGHGRWAEPRLIRLLRVLPELRYERTPVHASVHPAVRRLGGRVRPASVGVHHVDGLLPRRARGKRKRYIGLLQERVRAGDRSAAVYLHLAMELLGAGRPAEATRAWRLAGERMSGCPGADGAQRAALRLRAALVHGYLCLGRGDGRAALAALRPVLREVASGGADRTVPLADAAYTAAARAAWLLGDADAALDWCLGALRVCDFSPAGHLNAAFLRHRAEPVAALDHLRRAREGNDLLGTSAIEGPGAPRTVHECQSAVLPGIPPFRRLHDAIHGAVLGAGASAAAGAPSTVSAPIGG
jgi:hypothetical protein